MVSVVRTSFIPPRFLQDLYAHEIGDTEAYSYAELRSKIFSYYIFEFDYFSHYLNKGGRYFVEEIILNDTVLQRKWATEHGMKISATDAEIFEEQLRLFKPDIIMDTNNFFMRNSAEEYKKKFGVKAVFAWDGYTGNRFDRQSKGVDLVLTCVDDIKNAYTALGYKCAILPFAFDVRIFESLKNELVVTDNVCFSGTISDNVHEERKELLMKMIRSDIPFDMYISNIGQNLQLWSRAQLRALKDFRWKDYWDYITLQRHNLGGVYGRGMFKTLGSSLIQLNSHGDNIIQAGNMRLFEATGMGTLLLTDWKSNIAQIFTPEEEVITYKSAREAMDKARYFLGHPDEAKQIAMRGQARTIKEYSAEVRMQRFQKFCDDLLV
jgi:spore maturation protein CgeB